MLSRGRRQFVVLAMAAGYLSATRVSAAQGYPARPVRLLVGFTAGGIADVIARIIALQLTSKLGQPVIVENHPVAGGNLAMDVAANAAPDGQTRRNGEPAPNQAGVKKIQFSRGPISQMKANNRCGGPSFSVAAGMRLRLLLQIAITVFVGLSSVIPAAAEPKRVLLLHSYGRDFSPWAEIARNFRADLEQQSPGAIEFHDAALATERFGAGREEGPFVDYLHALFDNRRLDLIVAIGAPAARFVQERRKQLFPETPMLFAGVDQRRVAFSALTANDTVVSNSVDFSSIMTNILQVLPETTSVTIVVGNSPVEQYWIEQIRNAVQPYAKQVAFTWLNAFSLDDILKRAAALPPNSVIFYFQLSVDAAGVAHEQAKALSNLLAVANAPIFTHHDAKFGDGIVGGPLLSVKEVARQAAGVAVRILGGESAGRITTPPIVHGTPKFDWRELQRWNIVESRLPVGSEVYFRQPTMWQQYPWQISFIAGVMLIQTILLFGLLYEKRRRHLAEAASLQSANELAHMNRTATAGELSASIAHELKQPLAAMIANGSAGLRWLGRQTPDLGETRDALKRIVDEGNRATGIIDDIRAIFRKDNKPREIVDVNNLITETLLLIEHESQIHEVSIQTWLSEDPVARALADRVQLKQVLLNLMINAIQAMHSVASCPRVLALSSSADENGVLITVEDSGPGIDAEHSEKVFEMFYTTKPEGMGIGLPMSKSIIESHGGRLLMSSSALGGCKFQVFLPIGA